MSLERGGTANARWPRSALPLVAPVALCLISIPSSATEPIGDPRHSAPLRPLAARALVIGGPNAPDPGARRITSTQPRVRLTPRPTPTPNNQSGPRWFWLAATKRQNAVLFRSPAVTLEPRSPSAGQRPATRVTVMLHGMCDVPANECPSFASATDSHWLICPQASVGCNGGGATWHWNARVERIEGATERALSGRDLPSDTPRTLIGFSLGAVAALDVAHRGSQRYAALVLIAGRVHPDARRLKANGVRRVVLAAGEFDGTAPHLRAATQRLRRAGVEARFMSLGKVGHQFAIDMAGWLSEALGWAEARQE